MSYYVRGGAHSDLTVAARSASAVAAAAPAGYDVIVVLGDENAVGAADDAVSAGPVDGPFPYLGTGDLWDTSGFAAYGGDPTDFKLREAYISARVAAVAPVAVDYDTAEIVSFAVVPAVTQLHVAHGGGLYATTSAAATMCALYADLLPDSRRVLMVPAGSAGSGFAREADADLVTDESNENLYMDVLNTWARTSQWDLTAYAAAKARAALAYDPMCRAAPGPADPPSPYNVLRAVVFFGGTNDAGMGEAAFADAVADLAARVRAAVPGADRAPFVFVPAARGPAAGAAGGLAARVPGCVVVPSSGIRDDGRTFTADGHVALGARLADALEAHVLRGAPEVRNAVATRAAGGVRVTWTPSRDAAGTHVAPEPPAGDDFVASGGAAVIERACERVRLTPFSLGGVAGAPVVARAEWDEGAVGRLLKSVDR